MKPEKKNIKATARPQTFETLEREFGDDNDACIDAAKGFVECACRLLIEELDDPVSPKKPTAPSLAATQ